MTTAVTPELGKAEDLLKELGWDVMVDLELNAFFVAVPWLGWLSWLLRPIIKSFTDRLFNFFRTKGDEAIIRLMNDDHRRAFDTETVKLRIIGEQKGKDSDEYRAQKVQAKKDFAQLGHFIGV